MDLSIFSGQFTYTHTHTHTHVPVWICLGGIMCVANRTTLFPVSRMSRRRGGSSDGHMMMTTTVRTCVYKISIYLSLSLRGSLAPLLTPSILSWHGIAQRDHGDLHASTTPHVMSAALPPSRLTSSTRTQTRRLRHSADLWTRKVRAQRSILPGRRCCRKRTPAEGIDDDADYEGATVDPPPPLALPT
eukprot:GHVU01230007.1.p1 GENE.GHVU01230007.1~~GHVU01230007.1.p1  ORF type:complete len:188 (+),score=15.21 GHVU01230007.1:45-608(+)